MSAQEHTIPSVEVYGRKRNLCEIVHKTRTASQILVGNIVGRANLADENYP